ncbi:MAG: plasmid mobilization relaxosome protein MobC [Phenylobacterium zucineum]|nr:MAG: plasmid mobilization relaxosome protein MobC [Phenylobacterium zucineum]
MADFKLRLDDDLAARFDAWAAERGGRSPALRHVIESACGATSTGAVRASLGRRPIKLTVRLGGVDATGLDLAASQMGLTRNAWAAALIRRRLRGAPTFPRRVELAVFAIQSEVHRIGINVNQIARALNTAVLEGRVLDLELGSLEDLRVELRGHILGLREAFEGNLIYWQVDP